MTLKLTYKFNQGRYGWSENWYLAGTLATPVAVLNPIIVEIGNARLAMMTVACTLLGTKITDVAQPGRSQLYVWNKKGLNSLVPEIAPGSVYLVELHGNLTQARRNWYSRGVPDSWVLMDTVNGRMIIAPQFEQQLQQYVKVLSGNGAMIRYQATGGAGPAPVSPSRS